ncbi:MAG: FHA domain-containing protein [Thermoleophilaceae bacterium]|nr:FHA domain-containing protein [Thermoleophilaceae bacterium]
MADAFSSGTLAGAGSFRCEGCGFALALQERDELPECPECGGDRFRRALLFEPEAAPHGHHDVEGAPGWLSAARERVDAPGAYLAFAGEDRAEVVALEPGWTRVGRSLSADLRFDDPTVSRRHALVYHEPGVGARILDDRSLNGVFVNGERVDLAELADGDEIAVGRYTLFFLRSLGEPAERPAPSSAPPVIAT